MRFDYVDSETESRAREFQGIGLLYFDMITSHNTMMPKEPNVPPMNRGAPCTMLSSVTGAQVSDTTKAQSREGRW